MKIGRYIIGITGFLLVWSVVAVVVGLAVTLFVPPAPGERIIIGSGFGWRNLLGTILGLVAGIGWFRKSISEPNKKT